MSWRTSWLSNQRPTRERSRKITPRLAREGNEPIESADVAKRDARQILWLQRDVSAQQVISASGRANVVLRTTAFSDFRIEPIDFETRLQQAAASDARMVRETQAGLRYLEKRGTGERVVKEGFDTARLFMLSDSPPERAV